MKPNSAVYGLLLLTTAFIIACADGSSGSGNNTASKGSGSTSLAGAWEAKELSYTSMSNPGRTQDMKKKLRAAITMTIKPDGHYSYKVKMMGMSKTESGMMRQKGSRIIMDNPDFKMKLAGNTLVMTSDNHKWDFGHGKEAARSKAVFVRK